MSFFRRLQRQISGTGSRPNPDDDPSAPSSPSRYPVIPDEYHLIRYLHRSPQGLVSLVQERPSGPLFVHKQVTDYRMVNKRDAMEPYVLQDVLPQHHPRLTHLIDSFWQQLPHTESCDLALLYEYCRGGDLLRFVNSMGSTVPEDFIWHVFIQMAEALDVIHNRGTETVVHGDIKPDNVFLVREFRSDLPWPDLKLGDFGTATVGKGEEGVHVPAWQGPELPLLSAAGDVWGLGAIVHWMGHGGESLIRNPPAGFRGSREDWLLRPEARKPRPLPRWYSDALNDYMMDCLEWEPRDRVNSKELVRGLKRDGYPDRGRR